MTNTDDACVICGLPAEAHPPTGTHDFRSQNFTEGDLQPGEPCAYCGKPRSWHSSSGDLIQLGDFLRGDPAHPFVAASPPAEAPGASFTGTAQEISELFKAARPRSEAEQKRFSWVRNRFAALATETNEQLPANSQTREVIRLLHKAHLHALEALKDGMG